MTPGKGSLVRFAALAAVLAGVTVLLPAPAGAQSAQAPSPSDPWWPDPAATAASFGGARTWDLRIPLRVSAPPGGAPAGTPVQAHLDVAQSLAAAGWPATPGLASQVLHSFTLDPGSLRLVRHTAAWGVLDDAPLPVEVHLGWLDPDQRAVHGRKQTDGFDAQRDPLLTVTWLLHEDLAPGKSQNQYLYFDIAENGARSADAVPEAGREALGALHWLGAGTQLYGRNIGGNVLHVVAAKDAQRVEVRLARSSGAAFLTDHPLNGDPNPFPLAKGALRRYNIAGATDVQVLADQPVIAFLVRENPTNPPRMMPQASGEFVPSLGGGLVGHHFVFPAFAANFDVIVPQVGGGDGGLPDGRSSRFCVRLLAPGDPLLPDGAACPANALLDSGPVDPGDYRFVNVQPNIGPGPTLRADTRVEVVTHAGAGPVLVQAVPADGSLRFQAPSTRGAPVGQHFLAATSAAGMLALQSVGEPVFAEVIRPGRNGEPPASPDPSEESVVLCVGTLNGPTCGPPAGQTVRLLAARLERSDETDLESETNRHAETAPLAVVARRPPLAEPGSEGRLRLHGGNNAAPLTGAAGGDEARRFVVQGPFMVAAFYDDTSVVATSEAAAGPVARLHRLTTNAAVLQAEAAATVTHIVADKPVAVLPTAAGLGRALPAKPQVLVPQALAAQYRGYLVELVPAGGADPLFVNGRPGQTLAIPFEVRNLGRWNGAELADDIALTVTASPADWGGEAAFANGQSLLAGLGAEPRSPRLEVTLPPPGGALQDDGQVTLTVTGRSQGNPHMASSFTAVLSSRQVYKIEASFSGPGEPVSKVHPMRMAPGSAELVPFFVRNLGSGDDEVQVTLPPALVGWGAQVLHDGRPVDRVPIAQGQAAQLAVRIEAPAAEQAAASLSLPIGIRSTRAATAADALLVTARLALAEGLELRSDPEALAILPGGRVRYPVEVVNTGRSAESVELALAATLPAGWGAEFEQPRSGSFSLRPGQSLDAAVLVNAPLAAPARLVVPVMVRAEAVGVGATARDAIGLSTFVEPVHDVALEPLADVAVRPGAVLDVTLRATNRGNGPEEVGAVAVQLPGNWTFTPQPGRRMLEPGASATLAGKLRVPDEERPGPAVARLGVRAADGTTSWTALKANVAVEQDLRWDATPPLALAAGTSVERSLRLRNDGNRAETVTLEASAPPGWSVAVPGDAFVLPPGGVRVLQATFTAPRSGGQDGEVTLTARAGSEQSPLAIAARVEGQALQVGDVLAPARRPAPGTVGFVTVTLRNPTGTAQEAVHVRLLAGDIVVDDVRFAAIGPNGTVIAPLRWVEDGGQHPDRIDWGLGDGPAYQAIGAREFVQPAIQAASEQSPAAAAPVALALLAWAALRRRRA